MTVLNLGSLNIDHVYAVNHFVRPGETLSADNYKVFSGGKGLNQSISIARAKGKVKHLGCIGEDGTWLRDFLKMENVDISCVQISPYPSGHAVIQVLPEGENSIVIYGGANHKVDSVLIERTINDMNPGDILLSQHETNGIDIAMTAAKKNNLLVAFNPAPMHPDVKKLPLDLVDLFFLNEIEARELTDCIEQQEIEQTLLKQFPRVAFVLTLGKRGAVYLDQHDRYEQTGFKVKAIDTTSAGDTFIGYFLSEFQRSSIKKALELACKASAVCVTGVGAADSIPYLLETENFSA